MFSPSDMFATGRCRYPSKFCSNARAQKRNGELHRFCEEHRAKANDNQKRWSSTRQRQWDAMDAHAQHQYQYQNQYPHGAPQPPAAYGELLVPQPNYLPGPSKAALPPPTATRPQPIARTPSQSDRFLTHLLFQRSQSSSDMDATNYDTTVAGMNPHATQWRL